MFHTRTKDGLNNICGKKIRAFRESQPKRYSQRMLADEMQRNGVDMDKNIIQRIESGERFVTDIELKVFAKVLGMSCDELLK
ncbi:helix-turn-helix domain-containing protein [Aminipila sp.]|jgi:ribosome-binding protein aMBF1 (putative translation factor)|uniref:helix-turn-helix domain-containing protein n=1 Tax=Aminipila sp. TaxID=2060095 RepID=UPI001DEEDFD5|nr:helix-turn-helix transcriptional regulator [Aminipila sp.]MBE6035226.1 helix-turn-helix transcriptional regulator [Clostridiales bacterium]